LLNIIEVVALDIKCEKCDKVAFGLDESSGLLGDYYCEECRSE
jgi:Zn finger protein HypA/HybF involved in hydrogenase expression